MPDKLNSSGKYIFGFITFNLISSLISPEHIFFNVKEGSILLS